MTSPSVTFRLLSPAPAALSMVGMRQGMRQAAKIGHRYQINRHSWRRDSGRNNTIFPWGAHNMTTNPFLVHSPPTSTSSKIAAVLARLYVDLRFFPLLPFASLLRLITLSSIRPPQRNFLSPCFPPWLQPSHVSLARQPPSQPSSSRATGHINGLLLPSSIAKLYGNCRQG